MFIYIFFLLFNKTVRFYYSLFVFYFYYKIIGLSFLNLAEHCLLICSELEKISNELKECGYDYEKFSFAISIFSGFQCSKHVGSNFYIDERGLLILLSSTVISRLTKYVFKVA